MSENDINKCLYLVDVNCQEKENNWRIFVMQGGRLDEKNYFRFFINFKFGCSAAKIAVIDSGNDVNHQAIKPYV